MSAALEVLIADGVIDEVLGRLKSGKEADISLVRRGDQVVAAKVYKDRATRSFKNNADYKEGRKVRNSRTQRAMDSGGSFGRDAAEQAWKSAEADALYKLVDSGVRVPTPLMFYEGVLLMDLVRDAEGHPAPRMIDVAIEKSAAVGVYADLCAQIISMLCCDLIHGDLSPYNILAAAEGPTIIDFPQVVSAVHSSRAEFFFQRDFDNVVRFLAGFDPSLAVHTADGRAIWRAYVNRELTPEFVPPPPPPPRATRGPDRRSRPDDRGRPPQQRQDRGPQRGPRPPQQAERPAYAADPPKPPRPAEPPPPPPQWQGDRSRGPQQQQQRPQDPRARQWQGDRGRAPQSPQDPQTQQRRDQPPHEQSPQQRLQDPHSHQLREQPQERRDQPPQRPQDTRAQQGQRQGGRIFDSRRQDSRNQRTQDPRSDGSQPRPTDSRAPVAQNGQRVDSRSPQDSRDGQQQRFDSRPGNAQNGQRNDSRPPQESRGPRQVQNGQRPDSRNSRGPDSRGRDSRGPRPDPRGPESRAPKPPDPGVHRPADLRPRDYRELAQAGPVDDRPALQTPRNVRTAPEPQREWTQRPAPRPFGGGGGGPAAASGGRRRPKRRF